MSYFLTSDNVSLYYESVNNLAEKVIFLLPGFQCSTKFFCKNIEDLSQKYRVICMDLRGQGNSEKTNKNLNLKREAQDVFELIEFLKIEKVNLFGWSMGGNIVIEYHKQFGSRHLAKIGLLDSQLYPFSSENWNLHKCRNFNYDSANQRKELLLNDYENYCESLINRYYNVLPSTNEQKWVLEELLKMPKELSWLIYEDFLNDNCIDELKKINIPVLITATRHIGYAVGEYYLKQLKQGNYVYFNEGHCVMLENAQKFTQVILEFLT